MALFGDAAEGAAVGGAAGGPWGAVAGIGSSLLNSMFQGISSRRQNRRMVEFWRMNNEYNHPSAQLARLREAGLNPNLLYGQGVSGATGSSGAPPKAVEEKPWQIGNPLAAFQNTKIQNLTADNLRAQNTQIMNDAALKAANTLKSAVETDIKGVDLKKARATADNLISQVQYETEQRFNKFQQQNFTFEQNQAIKDASLRKILAEAARAGTEADNATKLGLLRDAQNALQKKDLEFYDKRAYLGLLRNILQPLNIQK